VIRKRIKLIKRRKSGAREAQALAYKKELECLELLRHLRHSNIIELLFSYEYKDEYYLLFPMLSMDLSEFLSREEPYGEFKNNKTFYAALSQLSSAIQAVHSLSFANEDMLVQKIGYHHDIRPQNILVTENTFVLTDFGLARFKLPEEGSETLWRETIGDYIAPECMTEDYTRLDTGRSIDIWSLGCLVTEIAAYMERGPGGVTAFANSRRRTKIPLLIENACYFEGEELRQSADRWLSELILNPANRDIRALVACARHMLQVKVKLRPKAPVVTSQLEYIRTKATHHRVESLFEQLIHRCEHESPVAHNRVTLSFHRDLFAAWGTLLGMGTDRFSHEFFDNQEASNNVCVPLNDLERHLTNVSLELPGSSVISSDDVAQYKSGNNPLQTSLSETLGKILRSLWGAVPVHYQRRMEQIWRQRTFSTEDTNIVDELEAEIGEFKTLSFDVGMHAALKRLTLEFERQEAANEPHRRRFLLNPFLVSRLGTLSQTHELGTLHQTDGGRGEDSAESETVPVVIEWVVYSPVWEGQTDEQKIVKLLSLAEILSLEKPETFHVLDCVGILPPSHELRHDGFAFVYAYPWRKVARPESLDTLLRRKDFKIMLEHKFNLAQVLATSLLELHSADPGWLHKNIYAANVLFFPQTSGPTSSVDIGDPYLVGFQHSRPTGEIWYSDMDRFEESSDYRDPRYIPGKTRFRKEFDYYSLGIVLLEIGFWQPIKAFKLQHPTFSAENFRKELMKRYVPKLGPKMGSLYKEVVRFCLEGSREIKEYEDTEDRFFWKVVNQLLKVEVAC
jgi:serine/threonine protein kinase